MEHETWSVDRIQVCAKQTQSADSRGFVLDLRLESRSNFPANVCTRCTKHLSPWRKISLDHICLEIKLKGHHDPPPPATEARLRLIANPPSSIPSSLPLSLTD